MAQLKDLIVNGASRLIGDAFTNKIQITTINAPTTAGGSTYGAGTNGNILRSNGTSLYWGTLSASDIPSLSGTYLPLAGGTMTGQIVLAATGFKTNATDGYSIDSHGNFTHLRSTTGDYFHLNNNAGTAKFSVYWENGNTSIAGTTTIGGLLTVQANQYTDSYSGAINMNNSNIYGLNSIYTADASDGAGEGIHFYRDTTHVDTLWMNGGSLLFVPNRELGTNTTAANSQKVARFTVNPTSGHIVITDGTTGGVKSYDSSVGSARQAIYLNAGVPTAGNYTVAHRGNAGKSNMNDVGRLHASMGMTNLSDPGNTTDNPGSQTSWHHYISISYADDPNASNAWVTQFANKAGTTDLWMRSRSGGTITDGTAWAAPWTRILTETNISNAISISGMNLLPNTQTMEGWAGTENRSDTPFTWCYSHSVAKGSNSYADISYGSVFTPEPNEYYTLSYWAKASADTTITNYFYANGPQSGYNCQGTTTVAADGMIAMNITTSWKKYWVVWKARSDVSGAKNIIAGRIQNSDATIYIALPKLEKGKIATDWTPNPGDAYHVYGRTGSTNYLYNGGAATAADYSLVLHGNSTNGSSGIGFLSSLGNTSINYPSDRAFIQYHPRGVTTTTAEGTAPTLATSGEAGRLVIGVGNDAGDKILLQAPGHTDLMHQMGASAGVIPDTNNTTGTVGTQYIPIYSNAGVLTQITTNSVLTNLASTTAASTYAASPRPGVTGTLPITNGGTGQTSAANVFSALSWTAGTTAGPTLSATVVGQNRTATIPSASTAASGVVTTDAQSFAGNKTFTGTITVNNGFRVQKVEIIKAQSTDQEAGWYRVCSVAALLNYANFRILLTGGWNSGAPTIASLTIQMRNGNATMKIDYRGFTGRITQVRLVKKSTNAAYIDVYLNATTGSTAALNAIFYGDVSISDIATENTLNTDTENIWATVDLSTYACQIPGATGITSGSLSVTAGNIYAGTDGSTAAERQNGVQAGSGKMYMFAAAAVAGNRGIYVPAHGTGGAKYVIKIDTNNATTFYGALEGNASSASSVAWSGITGVPATSIAWGAGTTAGPTLTVTAAGSSSEALAIPSASTSASGIVTTGGQSFKGRKTFGYMTRRGWDDSGNNTRWVGDTYLVNGAGTAVAEYWYDCGDPTNITTGKYSWRQYSPNSTANTSTTGKYETYSLPAVTAGLTENKSYNILTTKSTVTTGQGGTGNTGFTANRLVYSESATKLSSATSLYATTTALAVNKTSITSGYNFEVNGKTYLNNTTAASTSNTSSQLIVSNSDGGATAVELWRESNASWQLCNDQGVLYLRNNYTTAKQSTYSQNGMIMDYNTGNTAFAGKVSIGQTTRNTTYNLYVNGNAGISKPLTMTGTASDTAIINFSRTGESTPNYINIPASSALAFSVGSVGGTNIRLSITNTAVHPWNDSTVNLGTTTQHWSNGYLDSIFISTNTGYTATNSATAGTAITTGQIDITGNPPKIQLHRGNAAAVTGTISSETNYGIQLSGAASPSAAVYVTGTEPTTGITYSNRTIKPFLAVNGMMYASGQIESARYLLNNSTGGNNTGFYLRGNNVDYGRLFINTIGKAGTATTFTDEATGNTVTGYTGNTTGITILSLGNGTAVGTNGTSYSSPGTAGNADNARGYLRIYGAGTNYTDVLAQANGNRTCYLPNYNGTMYLLHGGSNSAIGSGVIPTYAAANGRLTAWDHEAAGAWDLNGAQDLNTKYDAGFYCIEGGSVTNYPAGSTAYANMIVMPYRKPSGNTKPDYALQIYGHSSNNRLWFRGSNASTYQAWQEIVHISANTAVGGGTQPVYVASNGVVTATDYSLSATINAGTANQVAYYSGTNAISSKAPAWSAWTAGTTAGPKANIQIGNATYTSDAIPSAAAGASGIVTTDAQQFDGNKTFKGHVYPQATYTYDLGSSSLRWKTAYVGAFTIGNGAADSIASKTITSNSTFYINRATGNSIIFQDAATNKMRIDTSNYFRPETNNTLSIGTSSYKWASMYATTFYGALSGNASTSTKTGIAAIWMYPENNNEINFGGTNTSTTLYFGYRTKDSRPIPTKFIFGGSTGTASLQCATVYLGSGTSAYINGTSYTGNAATATTATVATNLDPSASTSKAYVLGVISTTAGNRAPVYNASVYTEGSVLYGAAWNDYAEMREVPEAQKEENPIAPGSCVREVGDGRMVMSTERLQRGCKIISDTYGFNIGETDKCKTPIAVSGRVLVNILEGREFASNHIGWPVCSGPNGTVSIMTEEEEEKYPSRIIGTISEIPNYETWGENNIKVNGRIWIYVR